MIKYKKVIIMFEISFQLLKLTPKKVVSANGNEKSLRSQLYWNCRNDLWVHGDFKEFYYLSNLICKKILETTGPFELKLYKNDILNDG